MSDVPDEILREILSRLPVVPLLRFRCVSKSWKRLIDNKQFIKHHLNHSLKTSSNLDIILVSQCRLYSSDIDLLNQTKMAAFKQLSHPLKTRFGGTEILGSCDGLLVLRQHEDDVTILWNPSVRRFHEIPLCGIEFAGENEDIFYGFGYEGVSDDYKLIMIVQCYGKDDDEFRSEVKVYSHKSDSWRRIPSFPHVIRSDGVLANDALHWIVTEKVKVKTNNMVGVFDLRTEEFRLMALPQLVGDDYTCMDVVELGGCPNLMCYHRNEDHVDIWIMKEYGVEESWSVLFTFYFCDFQVMTPLAYSQCGRKVLLGLDDHVFMRYDLDKKSTTDVPLVRMPSKNPEYMYTCLQSLVLLNNGTCDFDLIAKKKQEMKDREKL